MRSAPHLFPPLRETPTPQKQNHDHNHNHNHNHDHNHNHNHNDDAIAPTRRAVMKPCAHVVCRTCTDTLVRPAMQCVVCDRELKPADVLELKREGASCVVRVFRFFVLVRCSFPSCLFYFIFGIVSVTVFAFAFSRAEGTGFAGGGMAETSKTGIAFQG